MKTLISIVIGILAFIGIFYLDGMLIDWVVGPIGDAGTRHLLKIGLWVVAIMFTSGLAIWIGILAGGLARVFMGK